MRLNSIHLQIIHSQRASLFSRILARSKQVLFKLWRWKKEYILIQMFHQIEAPIYYWIHNGNTISVSINSLKLGDAYMHQLTWLSLVQIMACRLFGAKPLSEPMIIYCHLYPMGHISIKYHSKFKSFYSNKCIWTYHFRNGGHFD